MPAPYLDAIERAAAEAKALRAGILVAIAVAAIATFVPAIFRGSGVGVVGFFPLPLVVLGGGLLLRFRGSAADRRFASTLLILGVAGLAMIAVFLWLVLQSRGY